jgi:hypothetical protein
MPGAAAAFATPLWNRAVASGARIWADAARAACASADEIVHPPVPLLSRADRPSEEDRSPSLRCRRRHRSHRVPP